MPKEAARLLGGKNSGPQRTGPGSQRLPRILQHLWGSGSAGRFCRTFHTVKNLLKKGSAAPRIDLHPLRDNTSLAHKLSAPPFDRSSSQGHIGLRLCLIRREPGGFVPRDKFKEGKGAINQNNLGKFWHI